MRPCAVPDGRHARGGGRRRAAAWISIALCATVGATSGSAVAEPAWHVGAESRLTLDRWRGAGADPVRRDDVRQRLRLGGHGLLEGGEARADFRADLEIGGDLGPSSAVQAELPAPERARFDLHHAYFDAAWGIVRGRLGRHLVVDELGSDALDGATVQVAPAPYVGVEASGGLAVRRAWSGFGPDLYSPDDAPVDRLGYVLGAAVHSRDLRRVQARAAWRRHFDAAVQREEAGLGVEARPAGPVHVGAGVRYDTLFRQLAGARAEVGLHLDATTWRLAWRRERPTFSADSIWNAFGAEPWDELHADAGLVAGAWRIDGGVGIRQFSVGETAVQTPGLGAPAEPPDVDAVRRSVEAQVRVEHALTPEPGAARIGIEGRSGLGYGGDRHVGDVFADVPWSPEPGAAPVRWRARVGAVWFADEQTEALRGWSGWLLLSAWWPVADSIALELAAEEHASRQTPSRVRVMGRLVVEEWL